VLDALMDGEVDDPTTLYKGRGLLSELVEPFEAFPRADGMEFRAKLRSHTTRKETTPRDFVVPRRSSKFVGNLVAGAGFDLCITHTLQLPIVPASLTHCPR
jgi:hypothetical protein